MKRLLPWCLLVLGACDPSRPAEQLAPTPEPEPAPVVAEPSPAPEPTPSAEPKTEQGLPVLGDPLGLLSRPPKGAKRIDPGALDPSALMANSPEIEQEPVTRVRFERDPRAVARSQESVAKPRAIHAPGEVRDIAPSALMQQVTGARAKARVLLLHASYCPACRDALPGFVDVARTYQQRGVHFSAASVDDDREAFLGYVPQLRGVLEPLWVQSDGSMKESLRRLGVNISGNSYGIPLVAVLDRSRKVVAQGGQREMRKLPATLDALLK